MRELFNRHARGLPLEGARIPIWRGEDDDLPDIEHMDLADQQAYREQYEQELRETKKRIAYAKQRKNTQISQTHSVPPKAVL